MKHSDQLRQENKALYEQAQQLIPGEGRMSKENEEKFDRMMADFDANKREIDRIEKLERMGAELQEVRNLQGGQPGNTAPEGGDNAPSAEEQQRASKEHKRAWMNYLRRGITNISGEDLKILRTRGDLRNEYRDFDNTVGSAGLFTVPTGFQNELEIGLKYFGGMRDVARNLTTATGATLPWPTTNDVNIKGRRLGANAKSNAAAVQDQSFGQVSFGAFTYTSDVFKIPNELLMDSAFNLEAEVRERGAERLGRIQNTEFTVNNPASPANNGGPTGMMTAITVGKIGAAGEVASFLYEDIIDLMHSVDIAYRPKARFMFHDTTLAVVRKMKDNYGRPLFGPGMNGEELDTICGKPYTINNDMPTVAAGAQSIAFGNFSKYVIRDIANSIAVVRLNELYALNNETGFVIFMRSDGQMVDAGTHPIKSFEHPAA